jgi:hypothetical protein
MKVLYLISLVYFFFTADSTKAQIYGCTDPLAINFNSSAAQNDGSCTYSPASIAPISSFNLAGNLTETSGLVSWNNQIWTHNDSNDINIYALDSTNGNIINANQGLKTKNQAVVNNQIVSKL